MKWLDVLLGRSKPIPPKPDDLFAMSTAQVTLEVNLNLKPSESAGISFRQVDSSRFTGLESDLRDLLKISSRETDTRVHTETDSFGFQWVILDDPQFEDLVATIHLVSTTLQDQGFGGQLLAAVFGFQDPEGQKIYWIYNYKRGKFYPMVPTGPNRRDNAKELRLQAIMERELPIEPDLTRWYPIWGIPF